MKRRLLLLAVLMALLLSVLRLPIWTRGLLAARLTNFFQRSVSVGEVRYGLWPPEIEVRDLRVAGPTPDAPPFLELRRALIAPSPTTLFSPRLVLTRLRLEGLRVRVHAYPDPPGGDDIPRLGAERVRPGTELRIRRLVIQGGEFVLDHDRVPLELDLPDFHGRLSVRRGGVLDGQLSFEPGRVRFGDNPEMPLGTEMEVSFDGRTVAVERAHLRTAKADLAYVGELSLRGKPRGRFDLNGPIDLGEIDTHVARTGFGLEGTAHFRGQLEIEGSRPRLKGRVSGSDGVFDAVPVPRFDSEITWDERGVQLRRLDVETLGGTGRLELDLPPGRSQARLAAHVENVDAEALLAAVFDIGAPGLGAAVTGDIALNWPRGRFRELSGTIATELEAVEDDRAPLHGNFAWHAEAGTQYVDKADLRTPTTGVRLTGTVEADKQIDVRLDGESTDLVASERLFAALRHALGNPEAQPVGLSGAGTFGGRLTGSLTAPIFNGRFSGRELLYQAVSWGRAEWAGLLSPYVLRSHSLVLRKKDAELWLDGELETGLLGEADALDLRLRYVRWPAEDLITFFGWKLAATGPLTGEAQVKGRRSAPEGTADVRSTQGSVYGVPVRDFELRSVLHGAATEVASGRAVVGGGAVSLHGILSDDGYYDAELGFEGVELTDVAAALGGGQDLGGRVSGEFVWRGPPARPQVTGRLSSTRLFFGDEGIGALDAALVGRGDGRVEVDARCESPRLAVFLRGHLAAAAPYAAELSVSVRDTSLDPFLRVVLPATPDALDLRATGELRLTGPLATPAALRGEATWNELVASIADYPVRNLRPIRMSLAERKLTIPAVRFGGEGTDFTLSGETGFAANAALDLVARGGADLRVLGAVSRALRGRGTARLDLAVGGEVRAPKLDGRLTFDGAGLHMRGFPHGIEDVRGSVHLTETATSWSSLSGTLGGGSVESEGQISHPGGKLTSFDVHAVGRGLGVRYPEGLKSLVDADLRLLGDPRAPYLTGEVEVRSALWTRRYDVASEIFGAGPTLPPAQGLGGGLRYDIRVKAPGTLRVDNNLATLAARADLTLQGSSEAPALLGRAQIDSGRVYFQGNTYTIRKGTLDFANPHRVDPLFDIEAEARVRSYRVTLKMNGTLDRVYPTLTSDPPLDAVRILSLLAGADESAISSLAPSQTERVQANLAAAGAATLAAGRLAEEVGLERGAERLFGLNRFSIDPSVVKGGITSPTARVSVGKRLTPDLSVLYSVDLQSTAQTLVSIEYALSDRLSLLLTRAEPGGFGFDLRLHRSR